MPFAAADCTPRCFLPHTQRKQSLAASGGPPASASRRQLLLGTRLRPTQGRFVRLLTQALSGGGRRASVSSCRGPLLRHEHLLRICRFETDLPL